MAGKYAGYVWMQAVLLKKLRFRKFPNTCRHGRSVDVNNIHTFKQIGAPG